MYFPEQDSTRVTIEANDPILSQVDTFEDFAFIFWFRVHVTDGNVSTVSMSRNGVDTP